MKRFGRLSGFSLAELIFAVGIYGLLMALTINKVIVTQQQTQNKAKFREAFASIHDILYEGFLDGSISDQASFVSALQRRMNMVKYCSTQSVTNGCWTSGQYRAVDEGTAAGFILPTGVTVTGIAGNAGATSDWIVLDINGSTSPNTLGSDTIELVVCYRLDAGCTLQDGAFTGRRGSGTLTPGSGSLTLFNSWMR